jgi:hypothetical protein
MSSGVATRIFYSGTRMMRVSVSGAVRERTAVLVWATKAVWCFGEQQTLLALPRVNPEFFVFLLIA